MDDVVHHADLAVTCHEHEPDQRRTPDPVVVVEILSPSTRKRDRGVKARRYAELGVEHYWIVDPERHRLQCHRLAGRSFQALIEAQGDTTLAHPSWDGLVIDLAALWR